VAMGILLVLEREFAEMAKNVLHLGVLDCSVLASEICERWYHVETKVGDSDDDDDTNRVTPDDDNRDYVDVAINSLFPVVTTHRVRKRTLGDVGVEPAEDTEERGQDVNDEDSANELERREGVGTTGDEDEPVLGESDFEEKDLLDVAPVLHNTSIRQEERTANDPSGKSKLDTKDDGDDPDLRQLPLDWTRLRMCVVVRDSHGGQVSEEGDEDDEVGADSLVDDNHGRDQVDLQVQT